MVSLFSPISILKRNDSQYLASDLIHIILAARTIKLRNYVYKRDFTVRNQQQWK